MKKTKKTSVFTALALSFAVLMMTTACGGSENESGGTVGRVTSISGDSITIDAFSGDFTPPNGEKPEGVPDDFTPPSGEKPEGAPDDFTPPSGEKPEGAPDGDFTPPSGEKPEGAPDGNFTPPSGEKPEGAPDGDFTPPGGENMKTESKTYKLTDSTAFFKNDNGSETEIQSTDIQPGEFVRIVADGETATEVRIDSLNK